MTDCKKCEINSDRMSMRELCGANIGLQDVVLKIDEKIIFHVIVGGKINPDNVVDKIQLAILDYVKELVNLK